jgi:hypothetical protein
MEVMEFFLEMAESMRDRGEGGVSLAVVPLGVGGRAGLESIF